MQNIEGHRSREKIGSLTLPDCLHFWLQQDLLLKVDNLALISVDDIERGVDN